MNPPPTTSRTTPPACPHAEAALLGAVLLAPQHAGELLDGIGGEHFTHPRHEAVLDAVRALLAVGVLPEPVAVHDRLLQPLRAAGSDRQRHAALWSAKAPEVVLSDLMEAVTTPEAAPYWRDLLVAYAERRRLINLAAALEQTAREAGADRVSVVLRVVESAVPAIDATGAQDDDRVRTVREAA